MYPPEGPRVDVRDVQINYDYGPYHIVASVPDANGDHPSFASLTPPAAEVAPATLPMSALTLGAAPMSSRGDRGEGRGSGKGRGHGKGGSYGRSVTPCWYFAKGKCTRGANCEFSHDLMPTKGARRRGGKGGRGSGGYGGRGGTKGGRKGGRRMEEATVEAF